eukprot:TRINITY_DN5135_c0_g1_i1.p1 TRINITY_DN5135_c0_g1~~TRINITY_DN5135_c0_g1_i1.p1  ORF type:complete len:1270 (-),score=297.71 TRINITY_DN5135_c0_g1_i1:659-3907(-)
MADGQVDRDILGVVFSSGGFVLIDPGLTERGHVLFERYPSKEVYVYENATQVASSVDFKAGIIRILMTQAEKSTLRYIELSTSGLSLIEEFDVSFAKLGLEGPAYQRITPSMLEFPPTGFNEDFAGRLVFYAVLEKYGVLPEAFSRELHCLILDKAQKRVRLGPWTIENVSRSLSSIACIRNMIFLCHEDRIEVYSEDGLIGSWEEEFCPKAYMVESRANKLIVLQKDGSVFEMTVTGANKVIPHRIRTQLDRCPSAISLNAFSPQMIFFASEKDVSAIMHKENERRLICLDDYVLLAPRRIGSLTACHHRGFAHEREMMAVVGHESQSTIAVIRPSYGATVVAESDDIVDGRPSMIPFRLSFGSSCHTHLAFSYDRMFETRYLDLKKMDFCHLDRFVENEPTVAIGNVLDGRYCVQIFSSGFRAIGSDGFYLDAWKSQQTIHHACITMSKLYIVHGRELLVFRITCDGEKPVFDVQMKLELNGEVSAFSVHEIPQENGEEKTFITVAKWEPCEFCVYMDWENGDFTPMKRTTIGTSGHETVARSIVLTNLDGNIFVSCGLGDGSLMISQIDMESIPLSFQVTNTFQVGEHQTNVLVHPSLSDRIFCASDEMACAVLVSGNHKKGDSIARCHRISCNVQSLESSIVLETDEFGPCIVGLHGSETEGVSSLRFISLEEQLEMQVEEIIGCSHGDFLTPLDNVGVIAFSQISATDSEAKSIALCLLDMKEKEVSHKIALKGCNSVGGMCALGEFDNLKREQHFVVVVDSGEYSSIIVFLVKRANDRGSVTLTLKEVAQSDSFEEIVSAIHPCGSSSFCIGEDDGISLYQFEERTKEILKIASAEFPFPACCTCLSTCVEKGVIFVGTAAGSILWYRFDVGKRTLNIIGHFGLSSRFADFVQPFSNGELFWTSNRGVHLARICDVRDSYLQPEADVVNWRDLLLGSEKWDEKTKPQEELKMEQTLESFGEIDLERSVTGICVMKLGLSACEETGDVMDQQVVYISTESGCMVAIAPSKFHTDSLSRLLIDPLSSVDVPASKARGDPSRLMDSRLLSLDRAQFMVEANDEQKNVAEILEKLTKSLL